MQDRQIGEGLRQAGAERPVGVVDDLDRTVQVRGSGFDAARRLVDGDRSIDPP
jgi:hypothetical protein